MPANFRPEFSTMNGEINSAGEILSTIDVSFAYEVLDKLSANSEELDKFTIDPKKYLADLGFTTPDGVEVYFIDKQKKAYPHHHDEPATDTGSRVVAEIYRNGYILGWCAFCFGCIN